RESIRDGRSVPVDRASRFPHLSSLLLDTNEIHDDDDGRFDGDDHFDDTDDDADVGRFLDDPMRDSVPSHGDASAPVHPDETGNPINHSKVSRSIGNPIRAYFDGSYMTFKEM
ncbi:hypothetical protein AKJ16_DCAP27750, partial [Drosera capensis]